MLFRSLKVNSATLEESLQGQRMQLSSKNLEIREKEVKIKQLLVGIANNKDNIKALGEDVNNKKNVLKEIEVRVIELENILRKMKF